MNQVDYWKQQMWKKFVTIIEWQSYWKLIKLIIGSSKCGKIVTMMELKVNWK